jgi:hypothetical protein
MCAKRFSTVFSTEAPEQGEKGVGLSPPSGQAPTFLRVSDPETRRLGIGEMTD